MSANELLTSTEAAAIASVGVSTIKRWADQGTIPYVRTVGGHRRFERSSVERLLRELASASGQRRGLAQTSPSALAEAHGVEQDGVCVASVQSGGDVGQARPLDRRVARRDGPEQSDGP